MSYSLCFDCFLKLHYFFESININILWDSPSVSLQNMLQVFCTMFGGGIIFSAIHKHWVERK